MEGGKKNASFKVIVLGDSGVGKTSLVIKQCQETFSFQRAPTIGTNHIKTVIEIDDYDVELKIWDTAGQEQFAALVPMYARGAQVCIFVASLIDPASIKHIENWHERLNTAGENPPFIVAINKTDMASDATVSIDQVREEYSEKYPNMYFVSARTGDCVHELFAGAAQEALKALKTKEADAGVTITEPKKPEKTGCC